MGGSTVAANVLTHGTGALNIDGCRIGTDDDTSRKRALVGDTAAPFGAGYAMGGNGSEFGRWPANVLLDEEAAAMLDAQTGALVTHDGKQRGGATAIYGSTSVGGTALLGPGDRGGASRFFYTSKASRSEREAGVDVEPTRRTDGRESEHHTPNLRTNERRNDHPTVKPLDVMQWLCRLVTPPGGVILDPFLGSGTTALAALDEGFSCIGIEREARYMEIAHHRLTHRHLLEARPVEPTPEQAQGRMF